MGTEIIFPPGSKCEAFRLGVHLILLYFIRILVMGTEIIFYFGVGVGVGDGLFLSLNLNNNTIYTLDIVKRI